MNVFDRRGVVAVALVIGFATQCVAPLSAASAAATGDCFGQQPTQIADTENTTVTGTNGADVILVTAPYVTVNALGGNDRICDDQAYGTVAAGAGNDRLNVASPGYMSGGPGDDLLEGYGLPDYRSAPRGIDADLNTGVVTGWGTDTLVNENSLIGSAYGDTIRGGGLEDILIAGRGNDVLNGRSANDVLDPGAGKDTVFGGGGNDELHAALGTKVFDGGAGEDTVSAQYLPAALAVTIDMRDGTLTATGVSVSLTGIEDAYGGSGDDFIYGTDGTDYLYGWSGNDTIYGRGGTDYLQGTDGDDHLYGGTGDDHIAGFTGTDYADGGPGTADHCANDIESYDHCEVIDTLA